MKGKGLLTLVGSVCLILVLAALSFMPACKAPSPAPAPSPVPAPAPAPAPAPEVIKLNFSTLNSELYPITAIYKGWIQDIEKGTGNRVKITPYFGQTLVSGKEAYQGVVDGVADIVEACLSYSPGRFPVMEVLDLPGYPSPDPRITTNVAWDLYQHFQPAELNDVHVLFIHNFAPMVIMTRDKRITRLEDLKGLRIRGTGTSKTVTEALGATPVSVPFMETYDLLAKGTLDGTWDGFSSLSSMKLAELTKYTFVCADVGVSAALGIVMNPKKWNSLPPDIQKVFNEVSSSYLSIAANKWLAMDTEGAEFAKPAGHEIVIPSPEEMARWRAVAGDPVLSKWATDKDAKGLPGTKILAYRQERAQYYFKQFGPIKLYK